MNTHQNKTIKPKDMYVLNLDLTRMFWSIAIALFLITFFFLFGYWLGSGTNYQDSTKMNVTQKLSQQKWIALNKNEIKDMSALQEVKSVTNEALIDKLNNDIIRMETNNREKMLEIRERTVQKPKIQEINIKKIKPIIKSKITKRIIYKDRRLSKKLPFSVQVSTNRIKKNALRLQKNLKLGRYPAYIFIKRTSKGLPLYFVRVGPFSTERKAQKVRQELRLIEEGRDSLVVNR